MQTQNASILDPTAALQRRIAALQRSLAEGALRAVQLAEWVRAGGKLTQEHIRWVHRRRAQIDQLLELEAALGAPVRQAALPAADTALLAEVERAEAEAQRAWASGHAEAERLEQLSWTRRLTGAQIAALEARWALSDRRYCLRALRRAYTLETAAQVRLAAAADGATTLPEIATLKG